MAGQRKMKITCSQKRLPTEHWEKAAQVATQVNPLNHAQLGHLTRFMDSDFVPQKEHIAAVTTKYWGMKGVQLTVGFMDNPEPALIKRILSHMNAWAEDGRANIKFTQTDQVADAHVRINRTPGDGYWSYLGTDILLIAKDENTMNLEEFTMDTPDSEFYRVVRHETGHTLGFPHEHMRKAFVDKLDVQRTLEYFEQTQGWSEAEVKAQVLTPIEEINLIPGPADAKSIMCYQIPGSLTKDGKPILGGTDITRLDAAFCRRIYPSPKVKGQDSTISIKAPDGKKRTVAFICIAIFRAGLPVAGRL
jgi:hypothetical protein